MASLLEQANFNQIGKKIEQLPTKYTSTNTYLKIAGIERSENALSNILAYYFTTNQPHGLGTMAVHALLESAGVAAEDQLYQVKNWRADRELATKEGRIDIVLRPEFKHSPVILIEHKVDHWLANDLDHYHASFRDRDVALAIVLAPYNPLPYVTHTTNWTYCSHLAWRELMQRKLEITKAPDVIEQLLLEQFLNSLSSLTMNLTREHYELFFKERKILLKGKELVESIDEAVSASLRGFAKYFPGRESSGLKEQYYVEFETIDKSLSFVVYKQLSDPEPYVAIQMYIKYIPLAEAEQLFVEMPKGKDIVFKDNRMTHFDEKYYAKPTNADGYTPMGYVKIPLDSAEAYMGLDARLDVAMKNTFAPAIRFFEEKFDWKVNIKIS